jgi:hypothetical protein
MAQAKGAQNTIYEALDKTSGTVFNTALAVDDRYIYAIAYYVYTQEELAATRKH